MFSNLRKRLEDSLDAVEALTAQQGLPRGSLDAPANPNHVATPSSDSVAPRRTGGMSLEERLRMKLAAAGATTNGHADVHVSQSSSNSQPIPTRRMATPPPINRMNSSTPPHSPAARITSGTPPSRKATLLPQSKGDPPPPPPPKTSPLVTATIDPLQVALPQSPEYITSPELSSDIYSPFAIPSSISKQSLADPVTERPLPSPTLSTSSHSNDLAASTLTLATTDPLSTVSDGTLLLSPMPVTSDVTEEPVSFQGPQPSGPLDHPVQTPEEPSSISLNDREPPLKAVGPQELEAKPESTLALDAQVGQALSASPSPDAALEGRPSSDVTRPAPDASDDVEKLRGRLKLVEQRFSDVSKSFKRLQAEKVAADKVLKELTPLEGIKDVEGLREHLRNVAMKNQMSLDEIKRLNNQILQHDGRVEDLRDTHHLESRSQTELIDNLRKQVLETEALLIASSTTTSNIEATSASRQAVIDQLNAELEKAKNTVRDEEDKRSKAIALLKTLRQKLVKAEKDKEDLQKEQNEWNVDREALKDEIGNGRAEIERVRSEKEREVANLKTQFDKELAGAKERYEKEASSKRAQFELDVITTKASHAKELATRNNRISQLETTVRALTSEKDGLFDQLQMRQAELESSQYQLEALTNENKDLQFRLREASDKLGQLTDEAEARLNREDGHEDGSRPGPRRQSSTASYTSTSSPAPVELARLLSETEGKYEARLSEMRTKLRSLEKERMEAEEEWSKNLGERTREVERVRQTMKEQEEKMRAIQENTGKDAEWEEKERELQTALLRATQERKRLGEELGLLRSEIAGMRESEGSLLEEKTDARNRVAIMEKQLDEIRSRETQLKTSNKTLREELRKVQSSAALLERQRNPGVGYWSNSPRNPSDRPTSPGTQFNGSSGPTSPRPATPVLSPDGPSTNNGTGSAEEEVNLEYLRNVILQFLEHKEMRPNLVRVLSIILHFTPQETRRLIAKV